MSKATYNVAQQNCLFLNKENVFSWLLTAYLNTHVSNRDANFRRSLILLEESQSNYYCSKNFGS